MVIIQKASIVEYKTNNLSFLKCRECTLVGWLQLEHSRVNDFRSWLPPKWRHDQPSSKELPEDQAVGK